MANEVIESNIPLQPQSSMTAIAMGRSVQGSLNQIQAAKMFPRDEYEATERIRRACQRKKLAEQATYSYPRSGKNVTGPSIRLAEAIARQWGNMDLGIVELSRENNRSELMAYACDLETNVRFERNFTVEHSRDTKSGKVRLSDERDIYENTANFGARRLRACILSLIPSDVVEMAVDECKKTIVEGGDKKPMQERLSEMLDYFKKTYGVTQEMLEEYCGMPYGNFGNEEIFTLQGVAKGIKDNMATPETYFPALWKERIEAEKMSKEELDAMRDKIGTMDDPAAVLAKAVSDK